MKNLSFLIFFSIIFSIHAIVNYYIYQRGMQALEAMPQLKNAFKITMLVLVLAYPLGRFLEHAWYSPISNTLHWIGAFWFAGMLYSVLLLFATDILRAVNGVLSIVDLKTTFNYQQLKLTLFCIYAGLTIIIILIGHINAWTPKIVNLEITVPKQANGLKELKIAAASDIHLGTIIGPRKTGKLVAKINELNPDIILLAGDVVDEDVQPVLKQNLGEVLTQLKAPLGVFAITGNHEYIGGAERAVSYLEAHNITFIRDTAICINNSFYIIGRDDKDKTRFNGGTARKELSEIMRGIDKNLPLIALDHQPFHLDTVENAGIDLQLSGHTHHGQLWPFNYITQKMFEVSSGYKQKGNSHFYVSNGFGTWGPPVRLGNRPEILNITLKFK